MVSIIINKKKDDDHHHKIWFNLYDWISFNWMISQVSTTRTRHVAHWGELDHLWHVLRHRAYAKIEANTYFGMSITLQTKLMRSSPMRLCLRSPFYLSTQQHIRLQCHHQPWLRHRSNVMWKLKYIFFFFFSSLSYFSFQQLYTKYKQHRDYLN